MNTNQYLTGIQGWLLLFVFQKVLAPLMLAPTLLQIFAPHTFASDRAHAIFLVTFISSALSALIGVLATIGIFRQRPWTLNAVAMNLLLILITYGVGFLQHGAFNSTHVPRAVAGIFYTVAWLFYFMLSERVCNTLGHNLFKSPLPAPDPISLP